MLCPSASVRVAVFVSAEWVAVPAGLGLLSSHGSIVRWYPTTVRTTSNGLALCALDHKLLDRGALGLTEQGRVRVSEAYTTAPMPGGACTACMAWNCDHDPGHRCRRLRT